MEPIDEQLIDRVERYLEVLYAPADFVLAENLRQSREAGLPAINVSAVQGKLLYLLAKIAGARRILEIGTLGGYSTTWLARALPSGGKLITLELNPKHAAVARGNLRRANLDSLVELRSGDAGDAMGYGHFRRRPLRPGFHRRR